MDALAPSDKSMIGRGGKCSLAATLLSSLPSAIVGFAPTTPCAQNSGAIVSSPSLSSTSLFGGISKWNEEYNMDPEEDEEELITRE